MPPMKCKCGYEEPRNYSRYYDSPDGCDIVTKTIVTTRYGIVAGLIISTYDVLMYSHAVGLSKILQRYFYHTAPLAAMGATFSVVRHAAHLSRNEDDGLNYFLGGLACGPILGSYIGSKHAMLLGGIALGLAGVLKKDSIDRCYNFIPVIHPHMGTIWAWRHDFTIVKDPKDYYVHTCGIEKKLCADPVVEKKKYTFLDLRGHYPNL